MSCILFHPIEAAIYGVCECAVRMFGGCKSPRSFQSNCQNSRFTFSFAPFRAPTRSFWLAQFPRGALQLANLAKWHNIGGRTRHCPCLTPQPVQSQNTAFCRPPIGNALLGTSNANWCGKTTPCLPFERLPWNWAKAKLFVK